MEVFLIVLDYLSTLAGGVLFSFVTRQFLPARKGVFPCLALVLTHSLTVMMVIFIGDPVNILFILPVFFAGILLFCTGRLVARLSIAAILFPMAMSVNAVLDVAVPLDHGTAQLRLAYWLAVWLFVRRALPRQTLTLPARFWLVIDMLALLPFVCTLTIILLGDYAAKPAQLVDSFIILGFAAVASLVVLVAVVLFQRQHNLEQQQALWQIRNFYYQELEQAQTQVRHLRHDMANHLQVLAGLEGDDAKKYLRQLIDMPAVSEGGRYCENPVANAVLAGKAPRMAEGGIQTEIEVKIPKTVAVADIDLCALFANGIDNAIEACEKLPPPGRFIHIRAHAARGLLVFQIKNGAPPPAPRFAGLKTTKKDAANHGFGVEIMRDVCRRYNGSMETKQEAQSFTLLLTLVC